MAADAPQMSSPAHGLVRGLLAALRGAGAVLLAALAALGAVTAPRASLLLGTLLAALSWVFVRALSHSPTTDLSQLPHPVLAAAWMASVPAAAAGTAAVGLGPLGVAGATIAVALAVGWWGGACAEPPPRPSGPDADLACGDGALRDLLRSVPVDVLSDEWRDTAEPAVLDGEDATARARFRSLVIDELHRRDPVGTTRWLAEAPGAPPDRYVRDAQDRAP